MKDGRKFVVGQHAVPKESLDQAASPVDLLWRLNEMATKSMQEELDRENLVASPEAFGVIVRVVVECIAVPKS